MKYLRNNFLKTTQFQKEKNCFNMCLVRARRAFKRGEYRNCTNDLQDAIKSLNALILLDEKKTEYENAISILNRVGNPEVQMKILEEMSERDNE